jgi:16S rRNA C967 or C1407 C5-methylase (RsmB/RsmF family)
MRLAAQVRGGFYPAHEKAVALAASFLRPPVGERFAILDPCAGQGAAIRQLAELLGCPAAQTYAIELGVTGIPRRRSDNLRSLG